MASFEHGVRTSETATSLLATTEVLSAVPFVVGIAPVNMVDNPSVNRPLLCYSYAEAVQSLGFEPAKADANGIKKYRFNLSEFIYSTFNFYGQTPIILVNVLDPTKHKKAADSISVTISSRTGSATVSELGIIPSSLTITKPEDAGKYVKDVDFITSFDEEGNLVISSLSDEDGTLLMATDTPLTISAEKLDPEAVTSADIIGGVDVATGARKGLELIQEVYPKFGIIPTLVLSPGYSSDPEVAAIMGTKALNINTVFNAMAIVDLPSDTITKYSDVPSFKSLNNIMDPNMIACWPMVNMSETLYHMSTAAAGVIARCDNENGGGVPYWSPSNQSIEGTGLALADGSEVVLGKEEANYLNGEGIVTCLNFIGGWRLWGNRTACYPDNTDVKDCFISVKRMFQWVANTVVTTIWQKVDQPGNRRLIDSIVDTLNVWLNSLTARQQLLGGRLEFRQEDNSTQDLMDGKYSFKLFMTPPSPAEDLAFDLEIDVSYYETLFEE